MIKQNKEQMDETFIREHIKKIEKAMADLYFEQKRLRK